MTDSTTTGAARPKGNVRWIICGMLFFAVILSYIDRLVIGVLKPTLTELYGWTEGGYANTALVFQASYGIGFLFFGRLIDRIGPRAGYLLAMGIWTAAHIGHAFMTTTRQFALMRIRSASARRALSRRARRRLAMVQPARTRARHRHLQRGRQFRRDHHAAARPRACPQLRLAERLCRHRPVQHRLACRLVVPLPQAARATSG